MILENKATLYPAIFLITKYKTIPVAIFRKAKYIKTKI